LQERDDAVEHWLRDEVASAYDAVKSGKSKTHPASAVFDEIRARQATK
jgi:antitoxin ParD1/3/4